MDATARLGYESWLTELKRIALDQYQFTDAGIANTDWEAYRTFYDSGYTPEDAMAEDMSNG